MSCNFSHRISVPSVEYYGLMRERMILLLEGVSRLASKYGKDGGPINPWVHLYILRDRDNHCRANQKSLYLPGIMIFDSWKIKFLSHCFLENSVKLCKFKEILIFYRYMLLKSERSFLMVTPKFSLIHGNSQVLRSDSCHMRLYCFYCSEMM